MLALYKPRGVLSSFASQDDRPCLLDLVPEHYREGRLFHIGRLDAYSTGLLLLGSDGDLANALLHPRHPVPKVYEVRADGPLDEATLRAWREGRTDLDGRPLQAVEVEEIGSLRWRLTLREGRNRQIRRMFEAVRRAVLELHRTAFGPVQIGTMQPGEIRPLLPREIDALRAAAGQSDGD
jgi:23S rRNA pseudouridine2605 synthase